MNDSMNTLIKVMIVDDEPLARELIRNYLVDIPYVQIVAECADGFEALRQAQILKPDLFFLDVQMPKLNGFEMLEVLEYNATVIFTTAFDQYAIKAFEMNAIDYLLKPFSKERLLLSLSKGIDRIVAQRENKILPDANKQNLELLPEPLQRIVTRLGSKVNVIPIDRIHYLESADDYVMIHSDLGSHLKEKTMKYFEEHLPSQHFVRIHRSNIINLAQIAAIEPYTKDTHIVTLKCGAKLRASAEGYKKLRALT